MTQSIYLICQLCQNFVIILFIIEICFKMCNHSVRSYNRSLFLPLNMPTKLVNYFPCGHCVDCINQKKHEYSIRSAYQAAETFKKGGFALFDTLTYRDDSLKYYHDIVCKHSWSYHSDIDCMAFSRVDVNHFFKLLRIRLKRAGFNVDGNLKYLLTSEFGTTEGCTHRPHYHILFYVTFDIDPIIFSRFISDCWIHGRTDGVVFKGYNYVLYNRVFRGSGNVMSKLVNYVCKYVTKDLFVYNKLFRRAFKFYSIFDPEWSKSYKGRLAFRRFIHRVLPFHLQSNGFGISLLDDCDQVDYINNTGLVRANTFDSRVVVCYSLPLYYKRKLYQYYEYFNGRLRWRLNDLGKSLLWSRYLSNKDCLINGLVNYGYDFDLSSKLAEYQLLWRGLFLSRFDVDLSERAVFDRLYSDDRYYTDFYHKNKLLLYNYTTERENYKYGKYISDIYISDKISIPCRVGRFSSLSEFVRSPFIKDWIVVSSFNVKRFAGFDVLIDEYLEFLSYNTDIRNHKQSYIDAAKFRLKQIYQ